jgi:hypothetical protein
MRTSCRNTTSKNVACGLTLAPRRSILVGFLRTSQNRRDVRDHAQLLRGRSGRAADPDVSRPAFSARADLGRHLAAPENMCSHLEKTNVGRSLTSVAIAFLLAASCATAPQPEPPQAKQFRSAVSAPRRLDPPEDLSNTARSILRSRMASHARDMGDLMSAVMILEYPAIRERASRISSDVSLARPLSADATELNAALPERFFDLQDELKVRATALGVASAQNDAFRVADAYGKLSETCVSCHASYRRGRPR